MEETRKNLGDISSRKVNFIFRTAKNRKLEDTFQLSLDNERTADLKPLLPKEREGFEGRLP